LKRCFDHPENKTRAAGCGAGCAQTAVSSALWPLKMAEKSTFWPFPKCKEECVYMSCFCFKNEKELS